MTALIEELRYVHLGSADPAAAADFAVARLGMERVAEVDGIWHLRADQRASSLMFSAERTQAVGLKVRGRDALDQIAGRLAAHGIQARRDQPLARRRMARELLSFQTPGGITIELVWRPQMGAGRFRGSREAGITGFSHIGLCTTDAVRDEAFWTQVCNARVSDHIGEAPLLRIAAIHHTLALFPTTRKGIQHINHQMASTDDIQRAHSFIRAQGVPIVFGPGKHPTSSARFLYFEGPEGMVYEYSSGVCEINDEAAWRSRQFEGAPRGFCEWGAKPDIKEFRN